MEKQIICTVCPRGCHMTVTGEKAKIEKIEGNGCNRGLTYATTEFTAPVRILTTLVKIDGKENELLPVRSDKPVLKEKIFDCMEKIKEICVKLPVKRYDIVIENILGTGINIVATKDIK